MRFFFFLSKATDKGKDIKLRTHKNLVCLCIDVLEGTEREIINIPAKIFSNLMTYTYVIPFI